MNHKVAGWEKSIIPVKYHQILTILCFNVYFPPHFSVIFSGDGSVHFKGPIARLIELFLLLLGSPFGADVFHPGIVFQWVILGDKFSLVFFFDFLFWFHFIHIYTGK